ncbi:hypothetical protein COOONC_18324 [Cooperia oncophora]
MCFPKSLHLVMPKWKQTGTFLKKKFAIAGTGTTAGVNCKTLAPLHKGEEHLLKMLQGRSHQRRMHQRRNPPRIIIKRSHQPV